ncbi:FAD-dependent monooxygenase [Streptomyces sp. NPDC005485]|uniref:FAD-dependent monooxygenase n=1 Tax=Streptomyces sp. NPDC005485 TaxID=3155591 RepID=UPI0033A0209E
MNEQTRTPAGRRVLISGASIAGPALALALSRHGYQVTVVEKAPALRGGGFAVDFRGAVHRTVLEDLGVWEEVNRHQTHMGEQTFVDENGTEQMRLDASFMSGDVEIFRGDLSRILYERSRNNVEYVFGDSITSLTETAEEIHATFERSAPRTFDLVVGADGLHSNVRRLAFGDESQFLHHLGYYVAGFDVPNHLALDRTARWFNAPGRGICLNNYGRDPHTAGVLMVFAAEQPLVYDRHDTAQHKRLLAERYAGLGWEVPRILQALEHTDDVYLDAVAQIRMDRCSTGRVVLLGDAGYGATMGGMGTGLAVVGAHVLAGELATHTDHRTAFAAYEARIRKFAQGCQKTAGGAGPMLAPATTGRIRRRNRIYKALNSPLLAGYLTRLTVKSATDIELPHYPRPTPLAPVSAR